MKNAKNVSILIITALAVLLGISIYGINRSSYSSDTVDKLEQDQVESIIKNYVLNNPEIIVESFKNLESKHNNQAAEFQRNMLSNRDLIENSINVPSIGSNDADITIVTFYDYRCGHCKKSMHVIEKLIQQDPNIRVLFRELPILGEKSINLAKRALAVYKLDPTKFPQFHRAVMNLSNIDDEAILSILNDLSLDSDQISNLMNSKEIEELIDNNRILAHKLNIAGTPTVILNGEWISNPYDFDSFASHIGHVRTHNK